MLAPDSPMALDLRRGTTLTAFACALLFALVTLLAPAAAQAAPSCPPSATMPDTHSGGAQSTTVTCADPSDTGLNWETDPADGPQHGFADYDSAGGVSYFADGDYKGSDSWTTIVSDNEGGSTQIAFSVEVVNEAPVCQNVSIETPHGQQGSTSPDCEDPDGDFLTYGVNPAGLGTSSELFGSLFYDPPTDYAGPDSFTYFANDGVESSAPATVAVTVTNTAPECSNESIPFEQTLRANKPITLQLDCFDLDGDSADIEVSNGTDHGTLGAFAYNPSTGLYEATYTPTGGYTGADQFTFDITDGNDTSAAHNFDLTVTPNHAPECFQDDTSHAKVNQVIPFFFFCSDDDPNDQNLTYTLFTPPSHGTLGTITDGQANYTPNSGYTGADTFTVRASDGNLTDDLVENVHVANTPFCDTPAPATIRAGKSRSLDVNCTFPNDDLGTHTYQVVTGPAKGSLNPPADSLFTSARTYTADAGATGSDSYSVRVHTSFNGGSDSPAVTQQIITGGTANNAPDCEDFGPEDVYAGHDATLFPSCTDLDGDSLTYGTGAAPAHGTSSVVGNHLHYTAAGGYTGPDSVPFTVSDGHGGTTNSHVEVTVNAPQAPSCFQGPIAVTMRPGTSTDLQLDCFDPQGDDETYSVVAPGPTQGSLGSFDDSGGVTYTANAGATGQEIFNLRASNPVGNSPNQQVTITFDPNFNRAPVCQGNSFNPRAVVSNTSTPLNFAGVCSDPDGDPLQFVRQTNPVSGGSLSSGPAATLTYQSPAAFTGADSFTYKARDSHSAETPVMTYHLDVQTSIAPSCTPNPPPTVTLRPGQTERIAWSCEDPNSEQLTYVIVSPPKGSLDPSGDSTSGVRDYTAPGTTGPDNFTFKVRDASGFESPVYTQNVNVTPTANRAPTCISNAGSAQNVAKNHATVAQLADWCDDPDGDPLTFTRSATTNPQHGTTTESSGSITYTSTGSYLGDDSFSYVASDSHGGTAPGTYTVTVLDADAPSCSDVSTSTHAGAPVEVNLTCTDNDSGQLITLSASGATHGTLDDVDQDAHTVTFTPDPGYIGPASFTYLATDNTDVLSNPATVSVDVQSNKPACSSVAATTTAGTPVQVSLTCADPDSGDTLTLAAGSASHGTLGAVDQGAKKVTFTPAAGYTGSAGFSYTATDNHGAQSDPANAAVTVNAAPGGGTPGGGTPGGGTPGGGTPPDTTAPTATIAPLPKQKLGTVLKKGLGLTIGCNEPCVVTVKLGLAKALAKKLGIASADVTIGSAKKTLAAAGKAKVYVKLTAKARKKLGRAKSVKVKLALTAADTAGNKSSVSRSLTLKR